MWQGTHLSRGGGCLPDPCCALQIGGTPLHFAAAGGIETVVDKLLAKGAAQTATDKVGGEKGSREADREASKGNTHLFVSSLFAGFDMPETSPPIKTPFASCSSKVALELWVCNRESIPRLHQRWHHRLICPKFPVVFFSGFHAKREVFFAFEAA